MPRMQPPTDATSVTYNGQIVTAAGVEVLEQDVAALAFEGWTLEDAPADSPEED